MKRLIASILLLACMGCEQPPAPPDPPPPAPIKTTSNLTIRIKDDGSSYFDFNMTSNARSDAEAIEKAIKHLQEKLDGKVEAEDKADKAILDSVGAYKVDRIKQ